HCYPKTDECVAGTIGMAPNSICSEGGSCPVSWDCCLFRICSPVGEGYCSNGKYCTPAPLCQVRFNRTNRQRQRSPTVTSDTKAKTMNAFVVSPITQGRPPILV